MNNNVQLPPKKTATRIKGKPSIAPTVSKQDLVKYDVKLVASITLTHNPVVCVCETNAPSGVYFLQNINDVIIRQKMKLEPCYVVVDNGRLEVCLHNLQPAHFEACRLSDLFVVGKLAKP